MLYKTSDFFSCPLGLYVNPFTYQTILGSIDQHKNRKSFTDFLVHIHPPSVPTETLRFRLSYGLGGMCVTLIFLLFGSGILQLLSYEPATSGAYTSVQALYNLVPFGGWIRNIHYWSANLLVIVVSLHLLRVFLTGAIGAGRQLNWIIGLLLFFLILAANFSGYLLPWDQLAYWAVTICTNMMAYIPALGPWLMELFRGGNVVGPATLANFYVLHIAVIPGSVFLLMAWHFWLVRRAGGLVRVKNNTSSSTRRLPTVPNLIVRETAVGLSLVAVVMIMAVFVDAPLGEQANPGMSPNPAKAPWYFLGLQELLLHLHPIFAICVLPLLACALLVFLPFWQRAALPTGIWFGGQRGRRLALWAFGAGTLLTFLLIVLDEILIRTGESGSGMADIISRGYVPLCIVVLGLVSCYQLLVRKFKLSRAEVVMAATILCCAGLVALTITGIWFRGPGMQLTLLEQSWIEGL